MTDLSLPGLGPLSYDEAYGGHRSRPIHVPMPGRDDVEVVLVGYSDDPAPGEFESVVQALLTSGREPLLAASADLKRYCDNVNEMCDPETEIHVDLGRGIIIERRAGGDGNLYASVECDCEREPEHGLQLVLREGRTVTKLGPYDGHLSNADADTSDPSLESVVYDPVV